MAQDTGGSEIGGDVRAGGSVTGQDAIFADVGSDAQTVAVGKNIDIHTGSDGHATDADVLRELKESNKKIERALIGDPYDSHHVGLVATVRRMEDSMSSFIVRLGQADRERLLLQDEQLEIVARAAETEKDLAVHVRVTQEKFIEAMGVIDTKFSTINSLNIVYAVCIIIGFLFAAFVGIQLFG